MTTHEITHSEGPTVGDRLQHVVAVSAASVAAVWRAVQNRRTVGRLAEWDDRMLRDIGLTRGDVHAALAGRVAEDPSKRLHVLSSERRSAVRARRREEAVRRELHGLEI